MWTALGLELSNDQLHYDALRKRLYKVGDVTGIEFPVGTYCFRRGNGESLDSSSMSLPIHDFSTL